MRDSPDFDPLARVITRSLGFLLPVVLLVLLLPAATAGAPERPLREYIVSVAVADSARVIQPSNRSARQRIDRRNERSAVAAERLSRAHQFRTRFRFGNAFTGFSARLTPEQAAEVSRDPQVTSIRPARRFRIAAQLVPDGVVRVKAYESGSPGPDVDADVAVLDTGIGPGDAVGAYAGEGTPFDSELNIAGGYNCYSPTNPDRWADTHWHGTHVAGTIGARDNNVGTVGVAPGVRLWAVRVFQGTGGSEASIICGLDWVIATHSNPTPDIDVINMSIQGPRLDYQEDCDQILADPNGDPIHQGVCRATALGITVVAAAGNQGINANDSSPGGYDQVISVGAMTDYDGNGWGAAGTSGCDPSERDDTYANYSNHGREVDILAPGTCIISTGTHQSGDQKVVSTGTSMAAPHVAGAVARYLADHPDTPADKMRRIVRAAGRLDWDLKSDPRWSGINDTDEPNRVLDVKALTGGDMLKSWVYHGSLTAAGKSTSPATRVDVQRGGGYSGPANLDLTGLPAGVGSARFVEASLAGLDGLGTKLRFDLRTGGPEGVFDLGVRVNASGIAPFSRPLSLTVDRTGPQVTGLAARLRTAGGQMSTTGRSQAVIAWNASDAVSGVKRTVLQRKIGNGAWKKVGTPTGSLRVWLKKGQRNRFRVIATDRLGNTSASKAIEAKLGVRDSSSKRWLVPDSGGWRTRSSQKAYGGSLRLANDATGSLASTFKGKAVALVASMGPNRGSFRVRVDGGEWSTVDLRAEKAAHRQVVWGRKLPPGTHKLELQGLEGQTALDAILIIR